MAGKQWPTGRARLARNLDDVATQHVRRIKQDRVDRSKYPQLLTELPADGAAK